MTNLSYEVMKYFRWKRKCQYIIDEAGCWNADVLIIDDKDFLIEVECKISLSDFRKDLSKKEKHEHYNHNFDFENPGLSTPNKFFYCVPDELSVKALELMEDKGFSKKFGLLSCGGKSMMGETVGVRKSSGWIHKEKVNPKMKDVICKRAVNKIFSIFGKCDNCEFGMNTIKHQIEGRMK